MLDKTKICIYIFIFLIIVCYITSFNILYKNNQENFDPSLVPVSSIVTLAKVAQKLVNNTGTLTNPGNLNVLQTLYANNNMNIRSNTITFGDCLAIYFLNINNSLPVTIGNTNLRCGLKVWGNTNIIGTLTTTGATIGATTINGTTTITGNTTINGMTFDGNINTGSQNITTTGTMRTSTIEVTGSSNLRGGAAFFNTACGLPNNSGVDNNSNMYINNTATMKSTLIVNGKVMNATIGDEDEDLGKAVEREISDAIVFNLKK